MEELLAVKAGIIDKLNGIQNSTEEIEKLTREIQETEEQMHTLALQIRESRKKGKGRLEEEMRKLLQELGIRHACFEVLITPVEAFYRREPMKSGFCLQPIRINNRAKLRKWLQEEKFPGLCYL